MLSGDGDGGDFVLLQSGWIARDKDGNLIEGSDAISVEFTDQDGSDYRGILNIKEGVKSVELGARWSKSNGDLTGDETVELRLSQSRLDGSELSGGDVIRLGEDGLNDCPPPSSPPGANDGKCDNNIDVAALGACDEGKKDGKHATFTFDVDLDQCDQ